MADDLFDFSYLTPTGTARCTLTGVRTPRTNEHEVVLIGAHAGATNERFARAYKNAALRGEVDDRKFVALFAQTVLTGWEHVNWNGEPMLFSVENATKFLNALIDAKRGDIVSAAFRFFADADRFVAGEPASDLGKA